MCLEGEILDMPESHEAVDVSVNDDISSLGGYAESQVRLFNNTNFTEMSAAVESPLQK